MGNPYVVLMQCVSTVYLISKTKGKWERQLDTIRIVVNRIELSASVLGENNDYLAGESIKSALDWMLRVVGSVEFDKDDLLAKVRIDLKDNPSVVKELERMLMVECDLERSVKRINSTVGELRYQLKQERIKDVVSKVNKRIRYSSGEVDYRQELKDLQDGITEFTGDVDSGEKPGFGGRLTLSNLDSIIEVLDKSKDNHSSEGVMQTGLVGFNRGCGVGGMRRGELVNVGALSHNYKSFMLNYLARSVALHNKPHMWDKKKKPLILKISFENTLDQDFPVIYKEMIEAETGVKMDVRSVNSREAAKYVIGKLGENGYEFMMLFYEANSFSIDHLLDVLSELEAEGYEIHLLVIDYLSQLFKVSGGGDGRDAAINDLFQVLRNHTYPRGITVVTAHQLSTEAQNLVREGTNNLPKAVSNKGYYQYSKSLHQKFDLEWVLHIHEHLGRKYLHFGRGKHRGLDVTPEKHKYFCYELKEIGGLIDDIHEPTPNVIYNLQEEVADDGADEYADQYGDANVTPITGGEKETW